MGNGKGGKTVLASSVGRDKGVRSSFINGIFWFYVVRDDKARVALNVELLARELAVAHADTPLHSPNMFDCADEAARHVSAIIKSKTLRCLVVLDNVWDVEVVNAFSNTVIPSRVTTRERTVIPPKYQGVMVAVEDMEEEEGWSFLRRLAMLVGLYQPGLSRWLPTAVGFS
ncbi:unnamed protein product [Ascophyllum nodosum]